MRLWLIGWLMMAGLAIAGPAVTLEAEDHPATGAASYRDPLASGKKCVGALLPEGGKVPLLQAGVELPAGDYTATFWLQPAPVDTLHYLAVTLQAGSTAVTLGQAQFTPQPGYQPVALRFVHPGGMLSLGVVAAGTSGFDGMRQTMSEEEKQTMSAEALATGDLTEELKDNKGGNLEGFDALDVLEEEKSVAGFKFYEPRVFCDRVVIETLRTAGAVVRTVEVDKVHYLPGETVQATAAIAPAGAPGAYTLVARDITEIDAAREVHREALELTAPATVAFTYPAGETEFGHALRISLERDGQEVHANEAYYGLSANVYRMGITGAGGPQDMRGYSEEKARALMAANKANYANYFERFAWAPCDYSNLAPQTEVFYSGQVQYPGSVSGYQNLLNEAHRAGVKGITYGKSCAAGIDGFNTFQRFPELFRVRAEGIPSEAFNVFYLERQLAGDYLLHAKPIDGGWQHWASLWLDWSNPRTVTYGAECIIDSVEMFGWDGIRWDGHFVGAQQPFIDMLNAKYPNFVHGYNIAFVNPKSKVFLPPARDKEDFHTVAKNHGLMMDESARDWSHTNFSSGLIRPFYEAIGREADYIKRIGGLPLFITFDMASPQDRTFNVLCGLAAGQRYTYINSPGDFAYGPLPKFLTRYAAFVWDDTKRVADPAAAIALEVGNKPEKAPLPWYSHSTWLRDLGDGRQQLLVNLLNPPGYPAFCNRVQTPAARLEQVKLTLALPAGATLVRALHVSPDLAAGHEPLTATTAGDRVTVTLPAMHLWSIVVLELAGGPNPALPLTTPVEDAEAVFATQAEEQAKKDAEARAKAGIAPIEAAAAPKLPYFRDYGRTVNADAERAAALERPAELSLRRDGILDVHHARGAFSWFNPVESAVGIRGGGRFAPSWVDFVGWKLKADGCMDEFPDTWEALLAVDVVALDNVHSFYLGGKRRAMLADFVREGGGLLVFGGMCNLSMGADHNTALAELLPIRIERHDALLREPAGLQLAAADTAFFGDRVDWRDAPVTLMVDTSPLREGVRVLATAGGRPAIVAHTVGKGRVITVLFNPHGDYGDGQTPYWQWSQWPRVLAACVDWLGEGHEATFERRRRVRNVDPDKVQPVELLMLAIDLDSRDFTAKLREAQVNVVDQDSARALLQAIVDNADKVEDIELLGRLLTSIEPYFDASFAPLGQKLVKANHPFLRAAGCQILGQAGDPAFRAPLEVALQDQDPLVVREALIGLASAGNADSVAPIQRYLKQGELKLLANAALLRLGETSVLTTALPIYSAELERRTRLRSGRRSLHEDLYGGVSFKLTPQQRKRLKADYDQIRLVERQLDFDLRFFAAPLNDLKPAELGVFADFLQQTENRQLLALAYAVYGRLPADQAAVFRAKLKEARLEPLRQF